MGRGGTGKSVKRVKVTKEGRRALKMAKVLATSHNSTRPANVQRAMKPSEKKNIDTTVASISAGRTDELAMTPLVCLNNCTAGALAAGQRVGRLITMKSILVRGRVHMPSNMTGVAFFRYAIVYDRESNGGIPAATDIFQEDAIWARNKLGNSWRFKILADYKHEQGMSPDDNEGFQFERYIKCNLPVRYVDGAGVGTYADIVEGSLWMVTWCGGASCATAAPIMNIVTRVRYEDN